jgi:hypothetical protein
VRVIVHTLGSLDLANASTLSIAAGANVSDGTASVAFGATFLSATGAVVAPGANTLLTLGSVGGNARSFSVTGAGDTTISGAITTGSGGITASQNLTIGTTVENGSVTVSANMTNGTGTLTKDGSGSFTFSGFTGNVGRTYLLAGTLAVGGNSTLSTAEFAAAPVSTLAIATGGTVIANYAVITTVFSGAISGGGTFQKDGAGALVFNRTFTAPNLTLVLNGGTLALISGAQITVGTIHITGNTTLDFGNSAGTVNGGALGGGIQVGGAPLGQIVFSHSPDSSAMWTTSQNGWFEHEIRPTPEPAVYGGVLVGAALALVGIRRRNRARITGAVTEGTGDFYSRRPGGRRSTFPARPISLLHECFTLGPGRATECRAIQRHGQRDFDLQGY